MNESASDAGGRVHSGRRVALLFASALALRLAALAVLAPHRAAVGATAWDFGHEAACLGESLAQGGGLADPWGHGTGPSGWLTPLYPALIAGLMQAFGGIGPGLALALFALQSLASAGTSALLVRLGRNLGAPAAGWWGGVAFALYPPAIWNAVAVVWDTTFVACATTAALALLTRPGALATARGAALAGAAWGALAWINPAPLVLLLPALGFLWIGEAPRARARAALALCGAVVLVCLPWSVRNLQVLGTANLRPNFGVELRLGNNPEANGHPVPFKFHPSHVPEELALYRELGETGYAENCRQRAVEWIDRNGGRFLILCARRIQYFWIGDPPLTDPRTSDKAGARSDPNAWAKFLAFAALGILGWIGAVTWRGPPRVRALLIGSLALYGWPYYFTHVSERYRFPIDPLLALLSAALVLRWLERRRAKAAA